MLFHRISRGRVKMCLQGVTCFRWEKACKGGYSRVSRRGHGTAIGTGLTAGTVVAYRMAHGQRRSRLW
jgi:hypothetical protein